MRFFHLLRRFCWARRVKILKEHIYGFVPIFSTHSAVQIVPKCEYTIISPFRNEANVKAITTKKWVYCYQKLKLKGKTLVFFT